MKSATLAALVAAGGASAPAFADGPLGSPRIGLSAGSLTEPDAEDTAFEGDAGWRFRSAHVIWDNDGTIVKPYHPSDRHYTSGLKFDVAFDPGFSGPLRDRIAPPDRWEDARIAVGFVLGQHIYTGRDVRVENPDDDDRPYAGYLFGGLYIQRSDDTTHDHLELNVGLIGKYSGAEGVQKTVHRVFDTDNLPQGWGTQLAHELAVNVRYQRSWRFLPARIGGLQLDGIPRLGFDAGNVFVRANGDMTLRVGHNLPNDFGPARLLDYRDATGTWEGDWGVYGFGRVGGRAVARNLFLDGNTFASSRSVDKRNFVGELEFGVMARFGALEIGYSITWNTKEFETQDGGDAHGGFRIGYVRRF